MAQPCRAAGWPGPWRGGSPRGPPVLLNVQNSPLGPGNGPGLVAQAGRFAGGGPAALPPVGGEFGKVEAVRSQPVAKVGAVMAQVVVLGEIAVPVRPRFDRLVLERPRPAFGDRHHQDRFSARPQHAVDFAERGGVLDMFEDVDGEDEIDAGIGKVDGGDVDHLPGGVGMEVGRPVARRRRGLDQPGEGGLGGEMEDVLAREGDESRLRGQRDQPVAVHGLAAGAFGIGMERIAGEIEPAPIAAARAIEGGGDGVGADRAVGVPADVAVGQAGDEAPQRRDFRNQADKLASLAGRASAIAFARGADERGTACVRDGSA